MAGDDYVRSRIYCSIDRELERQEVLKDGGKFPYTCADTELLSADKFLILAEEVGEVARVILNIQLLSHDYDGTLEVLREELVQVAAVTVAWLESVDKVIGWEPGL